jgi:hypothetical protein
MWYDSTAKSLAYYNDSSTDPVHIGQDLQIKVINNTGATIANGSPVYITGTSSGQTYPNVALARADVAATSSVIGLINGAIPNGSIGYVTAQGGIDNVNTSTYTVGQVLYLSPYSAGQLMNTIPPTGITVQVGVVTFVDSSTGKIYVRQTTPLNVPASIISGTVAVANGGTGATSLTANNVILGNGTSAVQVVAPGTTGNVLTSNGTTWQSTTPAAGVSLSANNTWTGTQTFSGTSSAIATVLNDAAEVATVSATAATGTINYDITTQSVVYYTSNASANWTVNFRGSSGTSLNTLMSTGQSMTVAFLVTQGSTAYYNSAVQIDGTTSGVTTVWLGGAPTAGNASGIDSYRYLIIKTGSATFTVLASNTQFKA